MALDAAQIQNGSSKIRTVASSESTAANISNLSFRPRRFLRGGHVQTLASFFLPRRFLLPAPDDRLIEVEPNVPVLCRCHWQNDRRNALTLILVHGLEGSGDSNYMLGIAEKGLAAGMNVVRMNQRTCGGTDRLAATLYHSGRSADVISVARNLIQSGDVTQFALGGFSMGGNIVLKAAGEWGASGPPEFKAAVAICPAADLAASADALHLPTNRLYEQYFLWKLKARMKTKAGCFPGRYDLSRLHGLKSLRDFDDKVTAFYCGFESASDYYARSAAANVLDKIAVPAYILYAKNDPFIRLLPETRRKIAANPNITFVETEDGGHCSFLSERNGYDGHFAEQAVIEFMQSL